MFDWGGFNAAKLKPQLKMAVHRFQMASNKKSALVKQSMREVAILLAENPPKEEKARIKAEAIIRDDYVIEAYDILSLNCELLAERIKLIQHCKECPPDLVSSISTLMYAAPRVDIPELATIRQQFRAKYGKQFDENAMNNVGGVLNERVVTKLSVQPPAAFLVQTYLENICEIHQVEWSPIIKLTGKDMIEPMKPPDGYSVQIAQGTGLGQQVGIQAHTGMTVNGDDDSAYGGSPMPPLAPALVFPSAGGRNGNNSVPSTKDDFAEPDIFIPPSSQSHQSTASFSRPPAAPTQPSAPPPASIAPMDKTDLDKDDDDNDSNNPGSGHGGQSTSYRDLAARFENLKNL